jgi:DNA-binding MarR family transcriptional regulator
LDGGRLHKLAKVLRQIAVEVTSEKDEGRASAAEVLVGMDVFEHAPTSVSEVAVRTGVAQSQVSAIVAEMRTAGIVTTQKDPRDGRRTLLRVSPDAKEVYGSSRGRRDSQHAIGHYLDQAGHPASDRAVRQIAHLLDDLADSLGIH